MKRASHRGAPHASHGARLPAFGAVEPQLATLVEDVPASGRYVFELKYDGYRTLAWVDGGDVRLASRRGHDWTDRYPTIARALAHVRAENAIFDGEVAYVREDGHTDFQKLQNALGDRGSAGGASERDRIVYFVFDLLFHDGVDLRGEPFEARREVLRVLLADEPHPLRWSRSFVDGRAFFREACALDLEGVVGKRLDRPYRGGRSTDWIKVKCRRRQEFVIAGYTPPRGSRTHVGALLLALRDREGFRYVGKVGAGLSAAAREELAGALEKLGVDAPRIHGAPRARDARWVEPRRVAEIAFSDWTRDGALRHPSFVALRSDKPASEVHRERSVALPPSARPRAPARSTRAKSANTTVSGVVVSHPERVMEERSGLTKLDLVRYLDAVGSAMLPFAARRPLMLLRCPADAGNRDRQAPALLRPKHSGQGLTARAIERRDRRRGGALRHEAAPPRPPRQHNTIELHGWGATVPRWIARTGWCSISTGRAAPVLARRRRGVRDPRRAPDRAPRELGQDDRRQGPARGDPCSAATTGRPSGASERIARLVVRAAPGATSPP